MKRWAIAAAIVVVATIAILVASPSWILQGCNDAAGGSDCGGVDPLVVAFVGAAASLTLLLIGAIRSIR